MSLPFWMFCTLLFLCMAVTQALPPQNMPARPILLGWASHDGIVKFEDIKKLSLPMQAALKLLRDKNYEAAEAAFQKVQRSRSQEALAYKGEIEASYHLDTLKITIFRYKRLLSSAENKEKGNDGVHLAVLHWALGEAIMMQNGYYHTFIDKLGGTGPVLSNEAKEQFQEALALDPDFLLAHLSLAAYYEHDSIGKGSLARIEYQEAFRLRPDLYQIRYLHAVTWDRPGILLNKAQLIKQGNEVLEDDDRRPEKAIKECLAIIRDHPRYAPPYYSLGDEYDMVKNEVKAKFYWEKYLELGDRESNAWKRVKSIVDYMNEHPS